jgi:CRP-like cAMP-binding protein
MEAVARSIGRPRMIGDSSSRPDAHPSPTALTRKLSRLWPLSARDVYALDDLTREARWIDPGVSILAAGAKPEAIVSLLEGFACAHQDFPDGRRQITALRLPGDLCGGHIALSDPIHYGVRTLTRAKVSLVPVDQFLRRMEQFPALSQALQRAAAQEEAILRAWMVNLGQRPAHERMAHLICEVAERMANCGLLRANGAFELPLTQHELGSALGLTGVHVNRVLQRLRAEGLIDFRGGLVQPLDLARLRVVAEFDPTYLLD